jgi:hypothetical protein
VQWDELMPEQFLITYAIELLEKGYRDSPVEAMAYDLQSLFDAHQPIQDIFETKSQEQTSLLTLKILLFGS